MSAQIRSLLVLPLALALWACGGENDVRPEGPGFLERPRLERVGEDGKRPVARLFRHLTPPTGLAPWIAQSRNEPTLESGEQNENHLRFDSWGRKRLTIPGKFDSAEFNQVAVRGVFPGAFSLKLTFTSESGAAFESSAMSTINTQEVQTILFDLPRITRQATQYTECELVVTKGFNLFVLHAIDLLYRPLALALPDPEGEGRPILLDHARHGVGVAKGAPVRCWIDVESDTVLRFAYGLPRELRVLGRRVQLSVIVSSENGTVTEPLPMELESELSEAAVWHQVSLSLAKHRGLTEVRFEVSASGTDAGEAVCALAGLSVLRPSAGAPSVLLVTSDTHRADHIGALDNQFQIQTPALDALAKRGVLFEDCYATTNVTSPSHVALMTALHPRDTRLVSNLGRLSDRAETLAERFREAGYMTLAVVSASQLGAERAGLEQGFDRMDGPAMGVRDAELSVGQALRWLDENHGAQVFVWLHLYDAHYPYEPPGEFDRLYYSKEKDPFDPSLPAPEYGEYCMPEAYRELRDIEYAKAQYRAEISYLDRELSKLFEHPALASGVFAVTADHGEILEKDGSYFNHGSLYPDTLHVPLILSWPGAPLGVRVERPIRHVDLGRTLLDLAGLESSAFPGESLVADLEGKGSESALPRFALSANASSASLTLGDWHYVLYLQAYIGNFRLGKRRHSADLFNMKVDPECLVNVAPDELERTARYRRMLIDWLTSGSGQDMTVSAQQTTAALEQLAALGYATSAKVVEANWIDPECECPQCEL